MVDAYYVVPVLCDCSDLCGCLGRCPGHTDLVSRIARRQKPLWAVIESCSEEVFKWEIVKDPMLTPIASRLAAVWPALSVRGEALRLFFLVRNPFDCVRAFVAHLGLQPHKPDGGGHQILCCCWLVHGIKLSSWLCLRLLQPQLLCSAKKGIVHGARIARDTRWNGSNADLIKFMIFLFRKTLVWLSKRAKE